MTHQISSAKQFSLAQRPRLVENPLLVEGISSGGKLLVGALLSAYADIEHFIYLGILEHIPYLVRLGFMSRETGKAIIQCQIDNFAYDLMAGRTFNLRHDDISSIYDSPHFKDYLQRAAGDRAQLPECFSGKTRYFPFVVHEAMPNIDLYFDAYPEMKVVCVERAPMDLICSWHRRGWGRRFGKDPLDFTISIQGAQGPAPWFAYEWLEEYEKASEVDRIIKSLYVLLSMSKEAYQQSEQQRKQQVHLMCFEHLVVDPEHEASRLGKFLDKELLPDRLAFIKAKQRLPRQDPRLHRDKVDELIAQASKPYREMLFSLEEEYSKTWEIRS